MKDFSIEDVDKIMDQQMEQVEDIIEILETSKTIRHPIWPDELKSLKEAFGAHDTEDWEKCRSALLVYLEYVYDDLLLFDLTKWNHRHLFRWQKMLEATKLGYESEEELYLVFHHRIEEEILHRIPPNFRLAYKDYLKDLSPGFIEMLQNFSNDQKNSDLHNEIIDFVEKDIEFEKQPT